MSAKKLHRSRARTVGRVTPKGVRPAGYTERSKPTSGTESATGGQRAIFGPASTRQNAGAPGRTRPVAVRSVHLDKGHRGGR